MQLSDLSVNRTCKKNRSLYFVPNHFLCHSLSQEKRPYQVRIQDIKRPFSRCFKNSSVRVNTSIVHEDVYSAKLAKCCIDESVILFFVTHICWYNHGISTMLLH